MIVVKEKGVTSMPANKRDKASDVFNSTDYAFCSKVSFSEAFPQIKNIRVEVEEDGEGVYELSKKQVYSKENMGEFINCSNSRCYNGGFNISSIIRNMVESKRTEFETDRRCQGYEGSPKGKKRYGPCFNSFHIKVQITYNE
jgi:hypothetical protein